MPLSERHAARVPPDVDQVGDAAEGLAVALEGDGVDEGAVEVIRDLGAKLAQLLRESPMQRVSSPSSERHTGSGVPQ